MKFNQPVVVGSNVRLRAKLLTVTNLRGVIKAQLRASLEIEGAKKTAYDADIVFLYHFK